MHKYLLSNGARTDAFRFRKESQRREPVASTKPTHRSINSSDFVSRRQDRTIYLVVGTDKSRENVWKLTSSTPSSRAINAAGP